MKKSVLLKDLVEKLGFEIVYKSDDYDKIENRIVNFCMDDRMKIDEKQVR